jgi:DNA-binding LacI/PurR family transcriptional regulator
VVSIGTPFYGPSSTLFGIEAAAREVDHALHVSILRRVDETGLRQALQAFHEAHVDGVIVVAPVRAALDALAAVDAAETLVVLCGTEAPGRSSVAVDQREGARLATRHLLEQGHDTVHHVRGPRGWLDADGREAGWREELAAWGVRAPRPLAGDWSPSRGFAIGQRIAGDDGATALFVANDQMAFGILLAMADAGRHVPEEVSVVGFDDTPESGYANPPLTTVRQDFDELGRRGVELLLGLIDGDRTIRHVEMEPRLVVRKSTAAVH